MPIELSSDDLNYIRAAITLVISEREELIDTGRLARELGSEPTLEPSGDSADYEETLRSILTKLSAD